MSEEGYTFLIEIVSCKDILIGDRTSSDPYVHVKSGSNSESIHKTKHILKTLNPTFTSETNNSFILSCTKNDLYNSEGLLFKVKDWDRIGSDDDLGYIQVAPDMLLQLCAETDSSGFPKEFKLAVPEKRRKKETDAGYIKLRCRFATSEDIQLHGGEKAVKGIGGGNARPSLLTNPFRKSGTSAAAKSTTAPPPAAAAAASSPKLDIFIQIVSCKHLMIGDTKTSDPYVKVTMGDKDLHWTKHLKETLMPVFDPSKHNSTFTCTPTLAELEAAGGLTLTVKDWDLVGSNDTLGYVPIPPELILKFVKDDQTAVEVKSFQLKPPPKKLGEHAGTIQIRLCNASAAPSHGATPDLVRETTTTTSSSSNITAAAANNPNASLLGDKTRAVDNESSATATTTTSPSVNDNTTPASAFPPFMVEINSCRGLLIGDRKSSDPYVKIKLGTHDLHKTKTIMKTLDPVFSKETSNFFYCDKSFQELTDQHGLTFKVKDYDRLDSDDTIGTLQINAQTLSNVILKGKEESLEFPLAAPPGTKMKNASGVVGDAGFLTLTLRKATATEVRTYSKRSVTSSKHALDPLGLFKKAIHGMDYGEPDLHILIEIVSCRGLLKSDMTGSDPYVKIKVAGKDVHETKYISKSSCPIYTVKHDCFFILDITTEQLKELEGVELRVKDYDYGAFSGDELGTAFIPAETLIEGNGDRLEFELIHPVDMSQRKIANKRASSVSGSVASSLGLDKSIRGEGEKDAGYVVIKCRPATAYDKEFLKNVTGDGVKSTEFLGYGRDMRDMKTQTASRAKFLRKDTKTEHGVKKFKLRPYCDPQSPDATTWMTKADIHADALKPSKRWLDISSGKLGVVHVEVLGADGLPNLDTDLGAGNVTDPFVAVIFEDSVCKTDVVDDCLSPRWLPWMQRAFSFRFRHISSNLYVGVFDYDSGAKNDHDLVGRVSVDLTKLRPDTEYLLEYALYKNSFRDDRKSRGTVTLRIRLELSEAKEIVMSNLAPPPTIYCSTSSRKDFKMVRNTIHGNEDMQAFSASTLKFYLDEILGNTILMSAALGAAETILFWRGQVPVFGIYLPLHSVILFLSGIILAEKPFLMPSFYFFSIAWVLLGIQNYRNNLPNPWGRTKGFEEIILMAAMNKNLGPQSIEMHENEEATIAHEKEVKAKQDEVAAYQEARQKKHLEMLKEHEELMGDVDDTAADTDISTQSGPSGLGMATAVVNPLQLLKPVLYPVQQYLGIACQWLRFVKNIYIWEEPYYATFLTIGSIALGLVFFCIPWKFIMTWTTRLVVWLLLGPHMKLVDIYWYSQRTQTVAEYEAETKAQLEAQLEIKKATAIANRIAEEDAIKLKDMKTELFGKFITEVPLLRFDRFLDVPLFTSTAKPYTRPTMRTRAISERVAGQHLVGNMIPRLADIDHSNDAPAKDPTEKKKE